MIKDCVYLLATSNQEFRWNCFRPFFSPLASIRCPFSSPVFTVFSFLLLFFLPPALLDILLWGWLRKGTVNIPFCCRCSTLRMVSKRYILFRPRWSNSEIIIVETLSNKGLCLPLSLEKPGFHMPKLLSSPFSPFHSLSFLFSHLHRL